MKRNKLMLALAALLIIGLSGLSAAGMTVSWEWLLDDPDVTAYRYQLNGEEEDGWTVVSGDTDSYTAEGLDPYQSYTLYLQRSYDGVNWSESAASTAEAMLEEGIEPVLPEEPAAVEPASEEAPAEEPAPVEEEPAAAEPAAEEPAAADEAAAPAAEVPAEGIAAEEPAPVEEEAAVAEPAAEEPAAAEEEAPAPIAIEPLAPVPQEEVVEKAGVADRFAFSIIPRLGAGAVYGENTPIAEFGIGLDFGNILSATDSFGIGFRSDITADFMPKGGWSAFGADTLAYFNPMNYAGMGSIDIKLMFDVIGGGVMDFYFGGGVGYSIGSASDAEFAGLLGLNSFIDAGTVADGWFASGLIGLKFFTNDFFSIGVEGYYRYYMPVDKHLISGGLVLGFTI